MDSEIEGDGVIENFYKLIWEKQEKDKGFRGFLLPDTVIYKYQQPRAWYFTNRDGCVKRKLKENLNAKIIEKEFLKNPARSKVVACFFYSTEKGRQVEYFEADDLVYFLQHRHKMFNGILQKFVEPLGRKNSTIQMIWTPHLSLFEKRENNNDLHDFHLNLYERVPTFEGESHQSAVKPFNGKQIRSFLHELGEVLSEHFSLITSGRVTPTRMVLIFKQSFDSSLYFLLATSIRCTSSLPLDISTTSGLPSIINPKRITSNSKSPLCVQKHVLCKSCENPCEVDRMCEISYRDVIRKSENVSEIPHLIQRQYPFMKIKEFLQVRTQMDFVSKVALVCDDCFLCFMGRNKVKATVKRSESVRRIRKSECRTDRTPPPIRQHERKTTPIEWKMQTSRADYPQVPKLNFTRSSRLIKNVS